MGQANSYVKVDKKADFAEFHLQSLLEENDDLRRRVIDIALQTAVLRERLNLSGKLSCKSGGPGRGASRSTVLG